MKKIVIMIGPPGSGKGTQAKIISAKFGYGHISTGDLLRALAKKKGVSREERAVLKRVQRGQMAPDRLIYKLAFAEINKYLAQGKGVVLDGAVRNVRQSENFEKFFIEKGLRDEVLAIEISLPDREVFNRLSKRRQCASCGEIIPWLPATRRLKKCPKCGGRLEIRPDDDIAIIKKRIKTQGLAAIAPVAAYFKKEGLLRKINGLASITAVARKIDKLLRE